MELLWLAVLLVGGVFYARFMYKRTFAWKQDLPAKMLRFFEKTGYRNPNMPDAPLPAQAQAIAAEMAAWRFGQPFSTRYCRDVDGVRIFFEQDQGGTRWIVPLAAPPRVVLHVAEAGFGGAAEAIKSTVTTANRKDWTPALPIAARLGDPELARRFQAWGEDPGGVDRVLADPVVREALLGCAAVDLRVVDHVRFDDPTIANLTAAIGGTTGAWATMNDPDAATERTLPMHDRICRLVARTATLCR
jgi:hypothetical protein